MNLLFGTCYDPGAAVTAFTTATTGKAIAAFDTTNLRATFTVPPSGYVRVRMASVVHGATTFPSILFGVMSGAGIVKRQAPVQSLGNTAVATALVSVESDFIVSSLTAGEAKTWDAGYGVETGVASTGVKYGGANDTTANNAFGGFAFEVWDPCPFYTPASGVPPTTPVIAYTSGIKTKTDFLPSATAGTSGGLVIAGANASISYASVTCTGIFVIGGVSNIAQTGDSFARIGAAGAGLTAIDLPDQTMNITGNITGNLSGSVGSVTGAVGSVTGNVSGNIVGVVASVSGLTVANLDATISSRMATYAQPSGFLTAVFPATMASPTNITLVGAVSGLTAANLDATVSSRLASASYTAPDNAGIAAAVTGTTTILVDTTAIKAKTSSLTFSVAGQVDGNTKSLNDTTVLGTGTAGDLWRG